MPVEKIKVINRLKALFPKANLSQKRLDALADKLASKPADDADETAIDAVINDFNSILSIDEIAREDDRVRTLEQKANPTPQTSPTNEPGNPDVPAWAKAILDSNESLKQELEAIKTGRTIETKKATASDLFAKSEVLKNIPESIKTNWVNRIDVNSETPFEDQIKGLEAEYNELFQASADNGNYAGPAGSGSTTLKVEDSVVQRMIGNI